MEIKKLLKTYQQGIVLAIGYFLVAGLAFGVGRISASEVKAPDIKIEQAFIPVYNTPETKPAPEPTVAGKTTNGLDCKGQIKGNISGTSRVYHMPGGSFYNRTSPEACFANEAEAQAAGFRKSKN